MSWQFYAVLAFFLLGSFYTSMKFATAAGISPELATFILQASALLTVAAYIGLKFNSLSFQYNQTSILYATAAGVLVALGNLAIYYALSSGPISKISPITGIAVAIPIIFGFVYFNEPINLKMVAGLFLAFISIFLLTS